jgi:hypothetical protein
MEGRSPFPYGCGRRIMKERKEVTNAMQTDRDSALVTWVSARLADVAAGQNTQDPAAVSSSTTWEPIARLGARFALDEREQQAVALAFAVAHSLAVARAARALSGARGLTVEVVREFLGLGGREVEDLLAADGRLRAHALLAVEDVPGAWPEASSEVALGTGLGLWLSSASAAENSLPRLGLGVEWIAPPAERPVLVDALAQLVRDDLVDVVARWVAVGGARAGDAAAIARSLAWRLRRPCLMLEGQALAALDFASRWELLAVARRESDLHDAPLIIDGAEALGLGWRALAVQPAPGRTLPAPIVLLAEGAALVGRPHPTFALREVQFAPVAVPAAPPPAAGAPTETAAPAAPATPATPNEDAFEVVRRQAALDAARAMGRPIAIPREQLPGRAVVPRAMVEAAGGVMVPRPEGAVPPPAPSTPVHAPPANRSEPPAPAPVETTSSPPAEPVRSAEPPAPAPMMAAAAPPAPPLSATQETAASEPEPAAAPPARPDGPDPAEALPYIEVPADAAVNDLIRLIPLAGNPRQRAELLRRLYTAKGNTQVAALLRAYTKSDHEAVRLAAEEGMAIFFGPNWNRSRPIPKPVQPPRSDDGGRGPHGAF